MLKHGDLLPFISRHSHYHSRLHVNAFAHMAAIYSLSMHSAKQLRYPFERCTF